MRRVEFVVGLVVLFVGLGSIAAAFYELPRGANPLAGSSLGPEENQSLPASFVVPSNATAVLPWVPAGAYIFGNFTVRADGAEHPSVSFYLLNDRDWSSYNSTYSARRPYPTSFEYAVANHSAGSWTNASGGVTPFVLLYEEPDGGSATVFQNASYSWDANGSTPVLLPIPRVIELTPRASLPGTTVVSLPSLGSEAFAVGGSFRLGSAPGGSARLYLLSANNSTTCPSYAFLPSTPACAGSSYSLPLWTDSQVGVVSWFFRVHGSQSGWDLVFVSSLAQSTFVYYNETEWDLPPGPVLDLGTSIEAVGSTLGFFGFLAITGAFVQRSTEPSVLLRESRPSDKENLEQPSGPGLEERTAVARESRDLQAEERTSTPSPDVPVGPQLKASPVTPSSLAGTSGRVTCGLCGTGYPVKAGATPRCPVCGSRSVVFTPPTTVELL